MVYAQTVTKHTAQPLRHLNGKCNFGQKIKYLQALIDGLLDKMYVNFGFSARCYPVQKHHGAGLPLL